MEDSLLFHLGFDPVFLLLGLLIFIIILFVLVISMHMKYNRLKKQLQCIYERKRWKVNGKEHYRPTG